MGDAHWGKHEKEAKVSRCREYLHGNQPGNPGPGPLDNLYYVQGQLPELATKHDWYMALANTVRDRLLDNWVQTPMST